jgi:hypothetical protein
MQGYCPSILAPPEASCPSLLSVTALPLLLFMQHGEHEYGELVNEEGDHYGGPFSISISPKMRVEELRKVIRVRAAGGGGPG